MDARLPDRWLLDKRFRKLTDRQYRTYFQVLVWSVATRTDGVVERDDFDVIPGAHPDDAKALFAAGLWEVVPDQAAYRVVDFPSTQTSKAEMEILENARRRDRDKKARQRARRKGIDPTDPDDQPTTVPGDMSRGTVPGGQHRLGEARQERQERQALEEEAPAEPHNVDTHTGEVLDDDGWNAEQCLGCGKPMVHREVGQDYHPTCQPASAGMRRSA